MVVEYYCCRQICRGKRVGLRHGHAVVSRFSLMATVPVAYSSSSCVCFMHPGGMYMCVAKYPRLYTPVLSRSSILLHGGCSIISFGGHRLVQTRSDFSRERRLSHHHKHMTILLRTSLLMVASVSRRFPHFCCLLEPRSFGQCHIQSLSVGR